MPPAYWNAGGMTVPCLLACPSVEQMEFGEFWHRFLQAESRGEAFKFELLDVKIWPAFRTRIFYLLAEQLGIFEDPHPAQESNDAEVVPFTNLPQFSECANVVIPFRRRIQGADPYSQDIIRELSSSGRGFEVLDYLDPDAKADITRLREWGYREFEAGIANELRDWRQRQLRRWQGWRPRLRVPMHYEKRWQLLVASLEAEFGVSLGDFHEIPRWRFRRYFGHARAFELYFRQRKTERVFLVNAYSNPDIVLGARKAGAKVVELQHGFISEMHPAYAFPAGVRSQVLPNELLVWGKHWAEVARLAKGTKVRVAGPTSQFLTMRERLSDRNRGSESMVLFTSQGALATRLLQIALDFARALPESQVIYRLHPNESRDDYEMLLERESERSRVPNNLSLSHREPIFLDLLGDASLVVGGFSTTLYEAMAFGLPVIALRLPGFEHLARAQAACDLTVLSSERPTLQEIRDAVAVAKPSSNPERYYSSRRQDYF